MNFKLIVAIPLIAAIPAAAYAQQDGQEADAPKPTLADVQKLVQSIAADKVKLKAYCDMGEIQEQMEEAEQEKGNAKKLDALSVKAENLSKQLGPTTTGSWVVSTESTPIRPRESATLHYLSRSSNSANSRLHPAPYQGR
jgi:hypothetical protein